MKIIIIGSTGTVGTAVTTILQRRHEVIEVSRNRSQIKVDINDVDSIKKMYAEIGRFDALIATTGNVHFAALTEMTAENYQVGLQSKLMGQINLVLLGLPLINDNGSFTLTSGIINHDPIPLGTSAAMVNGAIDAFVKSAAIEMPRNVRINSVSPTVLVEAMDKYADYFPGFEPVTGERVALAYQKSVEGRQTGQTYQVW